MITRRQFVVRGGLLVPAAGLLTSNVRAASYLPNRRKAFRSGLNLPTITSGTYILQLVADDLTAGSVSAWASRTGGWSASQGTGANQPTCVTDASGINGHNAVSFDGSNDFLKVSSLNLGGLAGLSMFLVFRVGSTANLEVIVEHSANFNSVTGAFLIYKTSSDKMSSNIRGTPTDYCAFDTTGSIANTVIVGSYVSDFALASNEIVARIDGSIPAGSYTANEDPGGTFSTQDSYIGTRGGTSFPFSGKLACYVICSGALDTTDRQAIENALMDYY